jgi:hypothetical protein
MERMRAAHMDLLNIDLTLSSHGEDSWGDASAEQNDTQRSGVSFEPAFWRSYVTDC